MLYTIQKRKKQMVDHISLGTSRIDRAVEFYTDCFLPLGYQVQRYTPDEVAFGTEEKWLFWLYPVGPEETIVGARAHVALSADNHGQVVEFYDKAQRRGATTVRVPGPRPDISPEYFGTVIRDLDGHTIEVVHWSVKAHTSDQSKGVDDSPKLDK
jgi:catechol 2,3-dioxygenase-like lactoylglutathione lyase family enzyme